MPTVKENVEEILQHMESQFGMCIRGSYPRILHVSGTRINHVSGIIFEEDSTVEPKSFDRNQIDNFFTVVYLGTECISICSDFKCGIYAVGNNNYNIREEREL